MPVHGNGWRRRWQMPKSQSFERNGFYSTQNPQVRTRKPKMENEGKSLKSILLTEDVAKTDQHKTSEVMIGFMSVPLGYFTAQRQDDDLIEAQEHCSTEHAISKPTKNDSVHGGSQSTVKLRRPVNWHEARGPMPVQNGKEDVITGGKDNGRMVPMKLVYDLVLRVIIGLILTHQWTIIQKESCSRLTINPVPDPLENS